MAPVQRSVDRTRCCQAPSIETVLALAEELDTALEGLPHSLHAVVDPDALDSLVANSPSLVSVQFQYGDRTVTVDSAGTIDVRETTQ